MSHQSTRHMWTPQRKELPEQCSSCPFRRGNNKAFGEVVNKLRASLGMGPADAFEVGMARFNIRAEVKDRGDFICHGTAYNDDMTKREPKCHRQCPGATKYHKEAK